MGSPGTYQGGGDSAGAGESATVYRIPERTPSPAHRARSEQTVTGGHVPGNPKYMAPEFLLQPAFCGSVPSDLYSLGMCLYEAATGKPAYPRLSRETAEMWSGLRAHAEGKYGVRFDAEMFRQYPPSGKVIRKAMTGDPAQRFGSAAEMLAALKTVAETGEENKRIEADEDHVFSRRQAEEAEPSTVFVPNGNAVAAALAAEHARGYRARRGRPWMAAAAIFLIAGILVAIFLRGRMREAGGKAVAEACQETASFTPTAAFVATLRQKLESGLARHRAASSGSWRHSPSDSGTGPGDRGCVSSCSSPGGRGLTTRDGATRVTRVRTPERPPRWWSSEWCATSPRSESALRRPARGSCWEC